MRRQEASPPLRQYTPQARLKSPCHYNPSQEWSKGHRRRILGTQNPLGGAELAPLAGCFLRRRPAVRQRSRGEMTNTLCGRLVVVSGDERGRSYTLELARTTVGRGVHNNIVLRDSRVSRQHVVVERATAGESYRL